MNQKVTKVIALFLAVVMLLGVVVAAVEALVPGLWSGNEMAAVLFDTAAAFVQKTQYLC